MPAFLMASRLAHASIFASERARGGVGGELVRLSVGAEEWPT